MKKSLQCPKCDSDAIGRFANGVGHLMGNMKKVRLENYVCGECGYYESYMVTPPKRWTPPLDERQTGFEWMRPAPSNGPYR